MRLELKKVKAGSTKQDDKPAQEKKGKRSSTKKKRKPILEISVLPDIPNVDPDFTKARKVIKVQVRGQHKYKTVRAKILLNDNFEKLFEGKHFEKDKWQTIRDLTNEKMERIRKGSLYEFTKHLQETSKTAFMKIIKITKNWKVIGYFKNQKEMEEAVKDSCTQGDLNRVWCVRNKKTIFREEKKAKVRSEKKAEEPTEILPSHQH
ncbi:hypothetical protein RhiirA4_467269 [Rhizophagus irregularis]|uniref:Uncharacterized protein n=1 Tax=Rhizophagus irregularis TaxID=588596 RepID=A0A2I1GVP4_9GLOM|nr:hypothetical protein RhiirA4_467269 [Rhizophagus irregularis]